ncbi:MAG: hypothetical protein AAFQ22_06125 [Pseudomonadota bacterium]
MARVLSLLFPLIFLSACIVTAPAKAAYEGVKLAGKGVYYTGYGAYKVGEFTVWAADGALDGTERTLRLIILTADATGAVVRTTREINAARLDAELEALRRTEGIVEVIVERVDASPQPTALSIP